MSSEGADPEGWRSLLLQAYLLECSLYARFGFCAKTARKEGLVQMSALLQETAEHERSHAKRLFKLLAEGPVEIRATFAEGGLGATEDNLQALLVSKRELSERIYPALAEAAGHAGDSVTATVVKAIAVAERYHITRLERMADNLQTGRVFEREEERVWRCRKCGYLHTGATAPKACPACAHPRGWFELIDDNF